MVCRRLSFLLRTTDFLKRHGYVVVAHEAGDQERFWPTIMMMNSAVLPRSF